MALAAEGSHVVLTAVIAAAALVIGGALTAAGSLLAARTKLSELQLTHRHELQSAHLEAARAHVETL